MRRVFFVVLVLCIAPTFAADRPVHLAPSDNGPQVTTPATYLIPVTVKPVSKVLTLLDTEVSLNGLVAEWESEPFAVHDFTLLGFRVEGVAPVGLASCWVEWQWEEGGDFFRIRVSANALQQGLTIQNAGYAAINEVRGANAKLVCESSHEGASINNAAVWLRRE